MLRTTLLAIIGVSFVAPRTSCEAEGLTRLPYNNPGLAVDLGVGLWAWPVPCDDDGDGDYDLIVACPDKPSNGVWLFENGTGDTRQESFPVFKPARRLSSTVHYVMPSYVGDGMRVLSPGFEYPDFVKSGLERPVPLPVEAKFYVPTGKQTKGPGLRHNQWRYADYDGDGQLDLIVGVEDWSYYGWDDAWNAQGEWTNGTLHGFVFWIRNTGTTAEPTYAEPMQIEADGKPVDVFGCASPNFADFDQDGDLDLLCGEFLDRFTYFENIGARTAPKYAAGQKLNLENGEPLAMDLQMIVPVAFDWDRDGDVDLVVGDEDGRVALVEHTGQLGADGAPQFVAPRYFQQEADTLKCGALATPYGVDWDGDGDFDILSGNTAGYIEFFENLSGPKVGSPRWAAPQRLAAGDRTFRVMAGPNGSVQGPAEAKWGYTTFSAADWDGDGLPDIVLNSIWGRVEWLRNVGTRIKPVLALPEPIEVEWPGETPKPRWTWWQPRGKELVTQWRTTPVVHDFNDDGLNDLAMLDTEGYLGYFERACVDGKLVLLPPRRAFRDADGKPMRLTEGIGGKSGRRKLCVTDWDGDGTLDFLMNSANADFYRGLGRQGDGWRFERAGTLAEQSIEGHDVSPTVVDFNGDGAPDFLGGAEDGRLYFLANPHRTEAATKLQPTETVLAYQRDSGGWPKNYDRDERLTEARWREVEGERAENNATIDNGATFTEIRLLAEAYRASRDDRFRVAALRGIQYLLAAQYANGGWPQRFPEPQDYARYITFNDNAMIGAMKLLQDVSHGDEPFGFVPKEVRAQCDQAVQQGVVCILRCQIRIDGQLTAWCAQHHHETFAPEKARAYELPSLSGSESVGITRFLMRIEEPSPEVVAAIDGAVAWFERAKLPGIKVLLVEDATKPKGVEKFVVDDPAAQPMWARFYDLRTNRPIFCSRDGIPRDALADISYERRNGYSWLGYYAQALLEKDLPSWRERLRNQESR